MSKTFANKSSYPLHCPLAYQGDEERFKEIAQAWEQAKEVRGWL